MKNIVKELNYNTRKLQSLGVVPFTLNKEALKGENVISWTTAPRFFKDAGMEGQQIINYVFDNVKKAGLDEMVMPDQPKGGEVCHEITYDEIAESYKTDIAKRQGTLWNVQKDYDAVFMTRETHFRVMEDYGRSVSLVFPAADCAIIRMYDKKKDVIGITHSDFIRTSQNVIGDMVKYMQKKYGSNLEDIEVYVGAFAKDGIIYDKYPPFAEGHSDVWDGYIDKLDDTHYRINYGDRIYDQLKEAKLLKKNIYFDSDNTIKDQEYFSNNRARLLNDREGRNLFGITFDGLPVYENAEQGKVGTRLK